MKQFKAATADVFASYTAFRTAVSDVKKALVTAKLALDLAGDDAVADAAVANASAAVDAAAATQAVAAVQAAADVGTAATNSMHVSDTAVVGTAEGGAMSTAIRL